MLTSNATSRGETSMWSRISIYNLPLAKTITCNGKDRRLVDELLLERDPSSLLLFEARLARWRLLNTRTWEQNKHHAFVLPESNKTFVKEISAMQIASHGNLEETKPNGWIGLTNHDEWEMKNAN